MKKTIIRRRQLTMPFQKTLWVYWPINLLKDVIQQTKPFWIHEIVEFSLKGILFLTLSRDKNPISIVLVWIRIRLWRHSLRKVMMIKWKMVLWNLLRVFKVKLTIQTHLKRMLKTIISLFSKNRLPRKILMKWLTSWLKNRTMDS